MRNQGIYYFNSHGEHITYINSKDYKEPYVCYDQEHIHYNNYSPSHRYLTFIAEEDGTFKFTKNSINYSVDDGKTWNTLSSGTNTPTIQAGNKIMFKATLTPTTSSTSSTSLGIGTFSSTGKFTAYGNPMSLLYDDDFRGKIDLSGKKCAFANLFNNCTGLTNAKNISLLATTLTWACYSDMFSGCTSLTTAPTLPATTLADNCYSDMFSGCTSLTTAPTLPATTLTTFCYSGMFGGCTSLTIAPKLPATTLAYHCYRYMFYGCINLNNITCLATNISAADCTYNWVDGVAASGTFTKVASINWPTGNDGIPSGWTIKNV